MMRISMLSLVALAVIGQSGSADKPMTDQAQIQGAWVVISLVNYGETMTPDMVQKAKLTFTENRFRMTGGEHNFEGTFTLHPEELPKTIEASFVVVDRGEKRKATGIYELRGDRLTVCWREDNGGRVSAFKSEAGSPTRLIVLQRARK
jgi:uncharacterized protein (TIGR03067 family)